MYIYSPVDVLKKNGLNFELIATEFISTVLNLENASNCHIKNLMKSGVPKGAKSKMAPKMAPARSTSFKVKIDFLTNKDGSKCNTPI